MPQPERIDIQFSVNVWDSPKGLILSVDWDSADAIWIDGVGEVYEVSEVAVLLSTMKFLGDNALRLKNNGLLEYQSEEVKKLVNYIAHFCDYAEAEGLITKVKNENSQL